MLLFVVSRFADVDGLVLRESARPSLTKPRYEHNAAPISAFLDSMVAILARLDDFILEEVLFKPVDCLIGPIVPTCVHPLLARIVCPYAVYLGHDGLGQVIDVGDVNPVA